jgi:hypothetical protein
MLMINPLRWLLRTDIKDILLSIGITIDECTKNNKYYDEILMLGIEQGKIGKDKSQYSANPFNQH